MLKISIHVQNVFLWTALISKLIFRFANNAQQFSKECCYVKILIPYPCILSSSKTLSKHIFSAPMFRFCFHSIRGAVGIREIVCRAILELPNRAHLYTSVGLTDYHTSQTLTGYILNACTMICFSCCHKKQIIYKPLSQINDKCVYKIKLVFLRWNTTTVYLYSSGVNHVRFSNLLQRMGPCSEEK